MAARNEIVDAKFEVEEIKSTMALTKPFEPIRHILRNGKDKQYTKKIEKELALDAKLGLNRISEDTAKKALIHDIDKLTSSRDYYPITKKQLFQLFKINLLNMKYCIPFNFIEKTKATLQIFLGTTRCQCFALATIAFYVIGFLSIPHAHWKGGITFIGDISLLIGLIAGTACAVFWMAAAFNIRYGPPPNNSIMNTGSDWKDDDASKILKIQLQAEINRLRDAKEKRIINFSSIKVNLDVIPLQEATIKIPYGAKLKAEEAFDTKIFETLVLAYPKFTMQKNSIEIEEKIIPKINLDPAICGVTADERLFMIVYWDVKKDIDRTIDKIKHFKKFKLKE